MMEIYGATQAGDPMLRAVSPGRQRRRPMIKIDRHDPEDLHEVKKEFTFLS